jgi:methylmalonyl-CoA mutase
MNIQADFPPVTKDVWLAQIQKDLKGAPLQDLSWTISDQVTAQPLVDHTDLPQPLYPLNESQGNWEIGERLTVTNPAEANAAALEALQGGAEGLCFHLEQAPTAADFDILLKDIHLDFIGLHFEGPGATDSPSLILALLAQLAQQRGGSTAALSGSIHYDPLQQAHQPDWRYLAELIALAHRDFPRFKVLTIQETAASDAPEAALAEVLSRVQQYMGQLVQHGAQPAAVAASMEVVVQIGQQHFVEIARLRAFQLLWLNWCDRWGIPMTAPYLAAIFNPNAYTEAIYTNLIKSTTMAMSAALGGAKRIVVLPYDEGREEQAKYPKAFARRMARNVQHLLKLESGLHTLTDPAAGSYYIEHLTHQIATAAWSLFGKK